MKYEIEFCAGCYLETAMDVAKALFQANPHAEDFGVKLKAGDSGEFRISRGVQTIYSKDVEEPLPSVEDIVSELKKSVGLFPASDSKCSC